MGSAAEDPAPVTSKPALAADDLCSVFEALGQGYCVCELVRDGSGRPVDYRFVTVNALFEEMTGLVEATGCTAYELVPDLEAFWVETYARAAEGETVRFQQGSDAMGRWFDVVATAIDGPDRFAIVFRDETARHDAEVALARQAERFQMMADQLPLIVWLHGPEGEQVFVNQTFCTFFGVERERMIDDQWHPLMHPDDADDYVTDFAAAVAERRPFHHRVRVRHADGSWRWIESWAQPRFEGGAYAGHLGTSADVSAQVAAERALEGASQFLRDVLDALFTFVGVLTCDGTLIEANRAPLEAAGLEFDDVIGQKFWDCYWWNHDLDVQRRLADAVVRAASGQVVRYDERVRVANDALIWIDFQLVPLVDTDGTVTHLIPSGLDITARIDAERDRHELLVVEQQRRRRAEILESNASRLAAATTMRAVGEAVLAELKESLGFEYAAINIRRGDEIEIVAAIGIHPEAVMAGQSVSVGDDLPGPVAIITNTTLELHDRRAVLDRFPHLAAAIDRYPIDGLLVAPTRASDGSAIGALVVGIDDVERLEELRTMLTDLAEQTGHALQRGLLYEQLVDAHRREHTVAVRLQRALLPDRIVDDPNLRIAARYEAADANLDVGGDWYDTFRWPDGQIGIVVGDVVGHDLEAAAAMGRLRAATAALAVTVPPDPIALLDALERVASGDDGADFVTATCVVVDPRSGTLRYAACGHPPPLIVGDGPSRWLDDALSAPIGLVPKAGRPSGHAQLRPGDSLVLYTDGLVERRGRPLDAGLAVLATIAQRHHRSTPTDLIDQLLAETGAADGAGGTGDDIVVIVARWQPPA